MSFQHQFLAAKQAAADMALLSSSQKNNFLFSVAEALEQNWEEIVSENAQDVARAKAQGASAMIDRLLLNKDRVLAIARDVRNVARLEDEVGKVVHETTRPNGLFLQNVRCPLGVVGIIYESRPNVTVDAAVLAIKSGNAVVLKGGKEAIASNRALVRIMKDVLLSHHLPSSAIEFLDTTERKATAELLHARGMIDVVIPRGGKGLIAFVVENAKVPVIETGASVVHTFVDASANIDEAVAIVVNEKTRRVSVCNALDTLLLEETIAEQFLTKLSKAFLVSSQKNGFPIVKIHAKETVLSLLHDYPDVAKVSLKEGDYSTEWLDYEMSVRIVKDINEAITHIQTYSLGHSESICSNTPEHIEAFFARVDSACVYANASTCFSDGAQFGLGAEIGISTQKMHVRGPFALEGLTSTKWIIRGSGQIRE